MSTKDLVSNGQCYPGSVCPAEFLVMYLRLQDNHKNWTLGSIIGIWDAISQVYLLQKSSHFCSSNSPSWHACHTIVSYCTNYQFSPLLIHTFFLNFEGMLARNFSPFSFSISWRLLPLPATTCWLKKTTKTGMLQVWTKSFSLINSSFFFSLINCWILHIVQV